MILHTEMTPTDDKRVFEGENIRALAIQNVVITGPPKDNGTFEGFGDVIDSMND